MAKGTPKSKPVKVSAKLRKTNPWFEEGGKKAKEGAVEKKRIDLRANGSKLTPAELVKTADELERIQREINDLETRHEELSGLLLGHWAHTSIEEIEGELGKTLITQNFSLSVDPDTIQRAFTDTQWRSATERRINPQLLLAMAGREPQLQPAVVRSARASVSIMITPPSSRRPRSGQPEKGDKE